MGHTKWALCHCMSHKLVMLQVMPEAVDETVQVKGSYSIGKAEEM